MTARTRCGGNASSRRNPDGVVTGASEAIHRRGGTIAAWIASLALAMTASSLRRERRLLDILYIELYNLSCIWSGAEMVEDIVRSHGYLMLGTRLKRIGERLQGDTQRIIDELAGALGVTQPGVTRAVGQLVKLGLVSLRPGRDDQRQRVVRLTAKGRQTVDLGKREIWPRVVAAVADLCRDLSGALLDQLTQLEDGLAEQPLDRRPGGIKRRDR
jgi:DNA-binding MarR family transcriptional regulator